MTNTSDAILRFEEGWDLEHVIFRSYRLSGHGAMPDKTKRLARRESGVLYTYVFVKKLEAESGYDWTFQVMLEARLNEVELKGLLADE